MFECNFRCLGPTQEKVGSKKKICPTNFKEIVKEKGKEQYLQGPLLFNEFGQQRTELSFQNASTAEALPVSPLQK